MPESIQNQVFVHNLHDYTLISNLDFIQTIRGIDPGPEKESFTCCELGCGFADTLLYSAVLYPKAHFIGLDYNPTHIEEANRIKEKLHLTNIRFEVYDLTNESVEDLGPFDYILCSGVYSWVNNQVRELIFSFCQKHLKEQGTLSLNYNTSCGNASFDRVAYQVIKNYFTPSEMAKEEVFENSLSYLKKLSKTESAFSHFYKNAKQRVKRLEQDNIHFIIHDLITEARDCFFLPSVCRVAEKFQLYFAGSSALIDLPYLKKQKEITEKYTSDIEKECFSTLLLNANMRFDLFQKNVSELTPEEQLEKILDSTVALKKLPLFVDDFTEVFTPPFKKNLPINAIHTICQILLEGPKKIRLLSTFMRNEALISLLLSLFQQDLLTPVHAHSPDLAKIKKWNSHAGDYKFNTLISPKFGTPLVLDALQQVAYKLHTENQAINEENIKKELEDVTLQKEENLSFHIEELQNNFLPYLAHLEII